MTATACNAIAHLSRMAFRSRRLAVDRIMATWVSSSESLVNLGSAERCFCRSTYKFSTPNLLGQKAHSDRRPVKTAAIRPKAITALSVGASATNAYKPAYVQAYVSGSGDHVAPWLRVAFRFLPIRVADLRERL